MNKHSLEKKLRELVSISVMDDVIGSLALMDNCFIWRVSLVTVHYIKGVLTHWQLGTLFCPFLIL